MSWACAWEPQRVKGVKLSGEGRLYLYPRGRRCKNLPNDHNLVVIKRGIVERRTGTDM